MRFSTDSTRLYSRSSTGSCGFYRGWHLDNNTEIGGEEWDFEYNDLKNWHGYQTDIFGHLSMLQVTTDGSEIAVRTKSTPEMLLAFYPDFGWSQTHPSGRAWAFVHEDLVRLLLLEGLDTPDTRLKDRVRTGGRAKRQESF